MQSPPTEEHPMITKSKAVRMDNSRDPRVYAVLVPKATELASVTKALQDHNWKAAMQSAYDALMRNQFQTLTTLPAGKNLIGYKQAFKLKKQADGSISKYKARLVAQGYSQATGFDSHKHLAQWLNQLPSKLSSDSYIQFLENQAVEIQ